MLEGDLNPHWFHYPSGYFYFLLFLLPLRFAAGILLNGWTRVDDLFYAYLDNPMAIAPWFRAAGIFVAIISIVITYCAIYKLVGRRWAWVAALFLAISPFYVHWSTQIWPEALIMLPSSICLYFAVTYAENGLIKNILLSGLALGAAISIKYNAVYLSPLIPIAAWIYSSKTGNLRHSIIWKHTLLSGVIAIIGFVLLTPFAVLDWKYFLFTFTEIIGKYREISHIGLDAGYALQSNSPHLWWFQALNKIMPGFIWIILISLVLLTINWKRNRWLLLGPIIVMVPFLTWFGKSEFYHLLPILPIFGGVLAVGARSLDSRIGKSWIISILILMTFLLPTFRDNYTRIKDQQSPDTRIEARNWIEENIPDGTKILLDKWYTPYLVRTKEQVEYLLENKVSDVYFKSKQKSMPRTVAYWIEFIQVEIDSYNYGLTSDGFVKQPDLLTPEEYAKNGFEYVVLSEETYGRFFMDEQYKEISDYYQLFFSIGSMVYQIDGEYRPGPKITILKLNP